MNRQSLEYQRFLSFDLGLISIFVRLGCVVCRQTRVPRHNVQREISGIGRLSLRCNIGDHLDQRLFKASTFVYAVYALCDDKKIMHLRELSKLIHRTFFGGGGSSVCVCVWGGGVVKWFWKFGRLSLTYRVLNVWNVITKGQYDSQQSSVGCRESLRPKTMKHGFWESWETPPVAKTRKSISWDTLAMRTIWTTTVGREKTRRRWHGNYGVSNLMMFGISTEYEFFSRGLVTEFTVANDTRQEIHIFDVGSWSHYWQIAYRNARVLHRKHLELGKCIV